MVQQINQSSKQATKQQEIQKSEQPLRSSFRSLSSGVAVKSNPAATSDAVVQSTANRNSNSKKLTDVVKDLNDAVSFSSLALESLERVVGDIERAQAAPKRSPVQELAEDLDRVRDNISKTLSMLRERAATAQVMEENIRSSEVQLEDVDGAREQAAQTGASINTNTELAVKAHSGLSYDRVAELLSEE